MPDPTNPAAGGGSDGDKGKEELKKLVDAAVLEATANLKEHNKKLIDEKKATDARNKELGDIIEKLGGSEGLERLSKMHESLQKDELGKLLSQGKHDEWFDQRTKALRADHEQVVKKRDEQIAKLTADRDGVADLLRRKVLETAVRAACTAGGVVDTAVDDVLLRAQVVFKHDPEKGLVIRDEKDGGVVLGKDGKTPKSVGEWLEEQKATARHWFPPSKGGDATGNAGKGGGRPGEVDLGAVQSMDEYREARKKLGLGQGVGYY